MPREQVVRITTAPAGAAADTRSREVRYMWSMGIRTLCFFAAIAVGPGWFRWVLLAGAVFLPYIAVVMANAVDQHDGGRVDLLDGQFAGRELTSSGLDTDDDTP